MFYPFKCKLHPSKCIFYQFLQVHVLCSPPNVCSILSFKCMFCLSLQVRDLFIPPSACSIYLLKFVFYHPLKENSCNKYDNPVICIRQVKWKWFFKSENSNIAYHSFEILSFMKNISLASKGLILFACHSISNRPSLPPPDLFTPQVHVKLSSLFGQKTMNLPSGLKNINGRKRFAFAATRD